MEICKNLFQSEFFDALGELNKKDFSSPCFNNCSVGRIKGRLNGACGKCDFALDLAKIEKLTFLLELTRRLAEVIENSANKEESYQALFMFLSQKRKQIEEATDLVELEKIKFFELLSIMISQKAISLSLRYSLED